MTNEKEMDVCKTNQIKIGHSLINSKLICVRFVSEYTECFSGDMTYEWQFLQFVQGFGS